MSLDEQLEQMRQASWGRWSKDKLDIVLRAREELARSGIVEGMLQVGAKAPDFALPSSRGASFRLYERLKSGPVVLAFYRGHW
jgi:hypothetical protein